MWFGEPNPFPERACQDNKVMKGDRVVNMYRTLHSCPALMKLEFSQQIFQKQSNIKFHEKPSRGAEFFHADRQTDMTKLLVAFRKFANAPKNET